MNELRWMAFAEMAVATLFGSVLGTLLKHREDVLVPIQVREKAEK